jgi:hypothetical protein
MPHPGSNSPTRLTTFAVPPDPPARLPRGARFNRSTRAIDLRPGDPVLCPGLWATVKRARVYRGFWLTDDGAASTSSEDGYVYRLSPLDYDSGGPGGNEGGTSGANMIGVAQEGTGGVISQCFVVNGSSAIHPNAQR